MNKIHYEVRIDWHVVSYNDNKVFSEYTTTNIYDDIDLAIEDYNNKLKVYKDSKTTYIRNISVCKVEEIEVNKNE